MIRTVITCDVCHCEIKREDAQAFAVIANVFGIGIERFDPNGMSAAHICGEACLHKHLSRLLPNL